jgi:hypothetical protein
VLLFNSIQLFYAVEVVVVGCMDLHKLLWQLSDGVLRKVWHCLEESVNGADTNDESRGRGSKSDRREIRPCLVFRILVRN